MAFSSAWQQMQSPRPEPDGASEAHRAHPPSQQFVIPRGVPLYPVEMIRRSRTISAATCRREQLPRRATTCAISIKYSSQPGRLKFVMPAIVRRKPRKKKFQGLETDRFRRGSPSDYRNAENPCAANRPHSAAACAGWTVRMTLRREEQEPPRKTGACPCNRLPHFGKISL